MAHYYNRQGEPCHTIIGKNGKLRDTNIKDVREKKLVPSVSGIIGQTHKPALEQWKLTQLLQSCKAACPFFKSGMLIEQDWDKLAWATYKTNTEQYSKEGSRIHSLLEFAYETGEVEESPEIIYPVLEAVGKKFPYHVDITTEKNFVSALGYGGQIDLVLKDGNETVILDFKTKQGDKLGKEKLYDDYCTQLAAYEKACGPARCFNVLISVTDPGKVEIHEWEREQLDLGWKKFACLLEYWKLNNNYESGFNNE